jgi:hypothetical protein
MKQSQRICRSCKTVRADDCCVALYQRRRIPTLLLFLLVATAVALQQDVLRYRQHNKQLPVERRRRARQLSVFTELWLQKQKPQQPSGGSSSLPATTLSSRKISRSAGEGALSKVQWLGQRLTGSQSIASEQYFGRRESRNGWVVNSIFKMADDCEEGVFVDDVDGDDRSSSKEQRPMQQQQQQQSKSRFGFIGSADKKRLKDRKTADERQVWEALASLEKDSTFQTIAVNFFVFNHPCMPTN